MLGKKKAKESVSKKLQVYEILKNRIVQNELKPQEYLNEQDLCEEFKVSKTPVREALQHLERKRLVVIVPNKGCFVSNIGVDLIREVFEIREIYECAAARIAASLDDKSRFMEILENHESFDITSEEKLRQSLLSGYQIHEVIVNSVGNSFLTEFYGTILDHIIRIRVYSMARFDAKRLHETCEEHKLILHTIISGDADKAEKAMRDHLQRSLISIDRMMVNNRKGI
ncbi:MAG: GntR family transcriptional regulator [Spirochaetes bacterium]|nr:GntR family transcriptional regulator [Spirochaetota bacterium]